MKQTILLFSLLVVMTSTAQKMSVSEFKIDDSDLTAITTGTIVLDQNGEKCALIKVEVTEFGFLFDVGSLGVVKTEQHAGEVWVYVPEGVKRISINHPKWGKVRDYDLGMSLKRGRTYILSLSIEKTSTDVGGLGTIEVKSQPVGSEVFIDDISVGKTPLTFSKLIPGKHKIAIKHEGYYDYESSINITEGKVTAIDENLAKSCDIFRTDDRITISTRGVTFNMIKIKGGTFLMGGNPQQRRPIPAELPAHRVTLSDYYIGETEVTNALWSTVMGSNPSDISIAGDNLPVNDVSWEDCQRFITRLSSLTGLNFFLPTEAQWEYAARGGGASRGYEYSGSNKAKDVGWYKDNHKTRSRVASLKPNELGVYDMSGGVWEWCSDWYAPYKAEAQDNPKGPAVGTHKVFRGGCYINKEQELRVANRGSGIPSLAANALGLRVVLIE